MCFTGTGRPGWRNLDDLPLLRAEPAQALLVVAGELAVHHFLERAHEIIERGGIGQQVGEYEVEPRVSPGEGADGVDPRPAGGCAEELGQIRAPLEGGDALQQGANLLHGERLEMPGVEEAEEGLVVIGDAVEERLRGAHGDDDGVVLEKGPPVPLLGHIEASEEGVEVLHEADDGAPLEVTQQIAGELLQRHGRLLASERGEGGGWELLRVALAEAAVDRDEQPQEAGGGLVFVQPGHSHAVGEGGILAEAVLDEGDEMGLSRAPRADKEQVMTAVREHAFAHDCHALREQVAALHEDGLEVFRVRPLRGEVTEKRAFAGHERGFTGCG